MKRKPKVHQFLVTVSGASSKAQAKTALMVAFGKRSPDGCSFYIKEDKDYRRAWFDGCQAGNEVAVDLILATINNLSKAMKKTTSKK